jgi:hypothetical protein
MTINQLGPSKLMFVDLREELVCATIKQIEKPI